MNSHLGLIPWPPSIQDNVLFCLTVLALICPCFGQNGPPADIIFNELFIDESGGDSSFIEIRRINSDTILDLRNHHIAILNSNRDNGFHLEVR